MTKLVIRILAAGFLVGGCASVEPVGRLWETPPPKEAFVLGSKLPRSENLENYQGAKSISRPDYQQYKGSQGGEQPMR